jgi:RHS repeat-associated protein
LVNTWSYFYTDHLGSIAGIANSSGVSDVGESFTAFGARRNPTTWSGAPTSGDLTTIAGLSRQGYTFQTALGQSMGLNHMNGRVQDAITGRFLSADPNIPDPTNTQSYNRYSYTVNNPLTFTDPTGFDTDQGDPQKQSQSTYTGSNIAGVVPPFFYSSDPSMDPFNASTPSGSSNGPASGGVNASLGAVFPSSDAGQQGAAAFTQSLGDLAPPAPVQDADIPGGSGDFSGAFGNQYFRNFTRISTVFKFTGVGALFVGSAADYYDAAQTGANNLGRWH